LTRELVRTSVEIVKKKRVGGQLHARRKGLKFFNQLRSEIHIIIKRNCRRGTTTIKECEPSFCNR
jgi:hypothetical protein